jgi:preprotein translocase subunit SecA
MALLRAHRGLPKNRALIKFLSETGRARAPAEDREPLPAGPRQGHALRGCQELHFTIDEKQHSIELTEKGVDLISGDVNDSTFFIMPDVGGSHRGHREERRRHRGEGQTQG